MTIGVAPRLRAALQRLASGHVLVIDYFASARCGVVVGDLTADLRLEAPSRDHVKIGDVEGVHVFAEGRLVPLLDQTSTTLDLRRVPFGRRLVVRVEHPELWLGFLEGPGVVAGKRPWQGRRA